MQPSYSRASGEGVKSNTEIESQRIVVHHKEVGMGEKKKPVESEEIREDQMDPPEFEVLEEMEAWALDDLSDLVPTTSA